MKKRVAIFDVDGTIFRSSLLIELVEALIHEGVFKPKVFKIYERDKKNWLSRKGDYQSYIDSVVRAFLRNIKGVKYSDFSRVAREVVSFHKDRVYRFTRDLVRGLKKKNYYILAISHSPREIVRHFCEGLGFSKVYGIVYELDKKKRLSGRILYWDEISDKARILRRAVRKENLSLRGSVGVGDTESDIPFLKMVERPICFNPNRKLYEHGKRAGWQIIVERKDVVYRI